MFVTNLGIKTLMLSSNTAICELINFFRILLKRVIPPLSLHQSLSFFTSESSMSVGTNCCNWRNLQIFMYCPKSTESDKPCRRILFFLPKHSCSHNWSPRSEWAEAAMLSAWNIIYSELLTFFITRWKFFYRWTLPESMILFNFKTSSSMFIGHKCQKDLA